MFSLKKLLAEGRSEPISATKAKSIYNNEASNFQFGKHTSIFRGNKYLTANFAVINPAKYETRKSENTENYYTLIMNNADNWSKFPKREIICTTSSEKGKRFGNLYYVVPFNNTEWGICSKPDIWRSFPNLFKITEFGNMKNFNGFLYNLVEEILNKKPDESSFRSFKKDLNKTAKLIRKNSLSENPREDQSYVLKSYLNLSDFIRSKYYERDQFAQFVIDVMDPEKNNFKFQNYWKGAGENKEVWTDGPCLLIKDGMMHNFT